MPARPSTRRLQRSARVRLDPATGEIRSLGLVVKVLAGPDKGQQTSLEGELFVGTDPQAGFKLKDPTVSRLHLQLVPENEAILVKDLGSSNGTYVAGARINEAHIEWTTQLTVGTTVLELSFEETELEPSATLSSAFSTVVAQSPGMQRVLQLLQRVAPLDTPTLFYGETGTGKDLLARALHAASLRRAAPFVVCECASLSPELVESELFGHVQGAFTGAHRRRDGLFAQADGGTLLLDEVAALSLDAQAKLLRVIETQRFRPVGADSEREVDVRVMATTHRWLEGDALAGKFRNDLFFRLAVVLVQLPPLRSRPEDLEPLAQHFLRQLGKAGTRIPAELLAAWKSAPWRGNVRELSAHVERLATGQPTVPAASEAGSAANAQSNPELRGMPFKDAKELVVERFTRDYVAALLERNEGSVSRAAEESGLARTYLHHLVRKLGLPTAGKAGK